MSMCSCRRSEVDDQKALATLISKCGGPSPFRKMYGSYNFAQLIEAGYLSLTAVHREQRKRVLGYISINDSPPSYTHGSASYLSNFSAVSGLSATSMNVLWVDFLAVDDEDKNGTLHEMLLTVFNALPEIDYIIHSLPGDAAPPPSGLGDSFFALDVSSASQRSLLSGPSSSDFSDLSISVCSRSSKIPTLSIRAACVQDHDDLVPIFDEQSEVLSEQYGPFFLAEMIESADPRNKSLVALNAEDRAVGLMSLTDDVELTVLQQCFRLEQFDYLLKLPAGSSYSHVGDSEGGDDGGSAFSSSSSSSASSLPPPRVVLSGPPASGRGTQCVLLASHYGAVPLNAGDLLREATASGSSSSSSDAGAAAIANGQLVPDDVVTKIVVARLRQKDCVARGYVLAGFPRTKAQAETLAKEGLEPHAFLSLDVPDDVVVERAKMRTQDPVTGKTYHEEFEPCTDPAVKARLVQRSDDKEDVVLAKLDQYHKLDSLYDGSRGKSQSILKVLNGLKSKNEVLKDAIKAVDALRADAYSPAPSSSSPTAKSAAGGKNAVDLDELMEGSEPNAFSVTLFCLDGFFESRSADFLPHAFAMFPDKDYCILTVPSNATESPLLKNFVPVASKSGSTFSHILYVLHRDALYAQKYLTVSRYTSAQSSSVPRLLSALGSGAPAVRRELELAASEEDTDLSENPSAATFSVTVGGVLVGLCVAHRRATSVEDINWLRANYHVDDFIAYDRHRARSQATIGAFAISSTYLGCARYVFREVMRLYEKTVLYYESAAGESIPGVIVANFVPVKPRERAARREGENPPLWNRTGKGEEKEGEGEGDGASSSREEKKEQPSDEVADGTPNPEAGLSLSFITKRLLTEPKITCNTRIVVVGASTAGISFIESLLFTPYLNFSNIILVSSDGLPGSTSSEVGASGHPMLPVDEDFPHAGRLVGLGLHHRIRVARCSLVELDRQAKAVVLDDDSILPYDVLVLASGRADASRARLSKSADKVDGVIYLDGKAAERAIWNACPRLKSRDKVVVYGNAIEALTAVNGLLKEGVSGKTITYIGRVDLGDSSIVDAVNSAMLDEGVTLMGDAVALEIIADKDKCLSGIKVRDSVTGKEQLVKCRMLICGDTHDCNPNVFSAVNGSGLVYDGRLVVDKRFRTVDESIYAAGTLTKFSRIHKRQPKHDAYNSRETGRHLASCVLSKVDPFSAGDDEPKDCPSFKAPRSTSAQLPGGYHYSRVTLPSVPAGSTALATGGFGEGGGGRYTALRVDPHGFVCELIYFGGEKVETRNLSCLVGLHESYLNSAVSSFDKGLVEDWIDFFREDWAQALYHDKFAQLHGSLRSLLSSDEGAFDVADLLARAAEEGKDDDTIGTMRKSAIGPGGENLMPSTKKMVESNSLEFLRKHKQLLPRYLLPVSGGEGK